MRLDLYQKSKHFGGIFTPQIKILFQYSVLGLFISLYIELIIILRLLNKKLIRKWKNSKLT